MPMNIDERFDAMEKRLLAAEDQLEIIRLLTSYGPLVDSGESEPAAHLWIDGGSYNIGNIGVVEAPHGLAAIYDSDGHQGLINAGSAHMTMTPTITVDGDAAEAVAYSVVLLREGDRWFVMRTAANHWNLIRTEGGWRIKERYNRVLDGSSESHDLLRRVMC